MCIPYHVMGRGCRLHNIRIWPRHGNYYWTFITMFEYSACLYYANKSKFLAGSACRKWFFSHSQIWIPWLSNITSHLLRMYVKGQSAGSAHPSFRLELLTNKLLWSLLHAFSLSGWGYRYTREAHLNKEKWILLICTVSYESQTEEDIQDPEIWWQSSE